MATIKKGLKKAQDGDAVTKSVKSYIDLQAKRANRRKNELTTGDLHTNNQANNKSTPESRLGSRATYYLEKIYNPKRFGKEKAPDKVLSAISKKKNGGSLSAINKTSSKRVGPVDPKGAFTKVQKKTLAGAKGKASLTKDKQLGATKMAKSGAKISKKK